MLAFTQRIGGRHPRIEGLILRAFGYPTWWHEERCPNCNGHIYCCGCDGDPPAPIDCHHR